MQFQVHTDVLTRQSEVFRDLLSLPQPADSETVDGSPLVRIEGTTAENMRLFLACLHDCTEYGSAVRDYTKVATLLRMSHKYQATEFHRHILADLSPMFPTSFDEYKHAETEARRRGALFDYTLLDCCVVLANAFRDIHATAFLPVALYRLCRHNVTDVLNSALLPANLRAVVIGRSSLASCAREKVFVTISTNANPSLYYRLGTGLRDRCHNRSSCPENLRNALAVLLDYDCWMDPLATRDPGVTFRNFCDSCRFLLVKEYESGRAATWESLPQSFELSAWAKLLEEGL